MADIGQFDREERDAETEPEIGYIGKMPGWVSFSGYAACYAWRHDESWRAEARDADTRSKQNALVRRAIRKYGA